RRTQPVVPRVADPPLDPAGGRGAGGAIAVSPPRKAYPVLGVGMGSAGEHLSGSRLGERVWDEASEVLDNLVDVHVSHLRRKIDREPGSSLIQTVRGFGYRLGVPDSAEV